MKAVLAILGLALIDALVECKPNADLQKKFDGSRRNEVFGNLLKNFKRTAKLVGVGEPASEGPWNHLEDLKSDLISLMGLCEAGSILVDTLGIPAARCALKEVGVTPDDSFLLSEACELIPQLVSMINEAPVLEHMGQEATEEVLANIGLIKRVFKCGRQVAETELMGLIYTVAKKGTEDSVFLAKTRDQLGACERELEIEIEMLHEAEDPSPPTSMDNANL